MRTLTQKQASLAKVATQSLTTENSENSLGNPVQLSNHTKSYYSCLLTDIEVKKFGVSGKSKDKSGPNVN